MSVPCWCVLYYNLANSAGVKRVSLLHTMVVASPATGGSGLAGPDSFTGIIIRLSGATIRIYRVCLLRSDKNYPIFQFAIDCRPFKSKQVCQGTQPAARIQFHFQTARDIRPSIFTHTATLGGSSRLTTSMLGEQQAADSTSLHGLTLLYEFQ